MDYSDINDLKRICVDVRKKCLELAFRKNPRATHFGGAMSSIEILVALYYRIMNYKVHEPTWKSRDRFFLSKGHCVLGYYSTLHRVGFLTDEDFWSYAENGTILPGHPVINQNKGIEFTNGSLGMGLSVAIGNAVALRTLGLDAKCFVLLGDGECNEGSVWEACMAATHHKLNRITAIIDRNRLQQTGSHEDIMNTDSLASKFDSFGWDVYEVNGNEISELLEVLTIESRGKPKAIIAHTTKGKGFSFSEHNNSFHHGVITKELFNLGLREIEKTND